MEGVNFLDLSMADYAIILAASLGASLVAGIGGFGGAFIIVIFVTPIVGAKAVVPLVSVFAFFSNLSRVFFYRHNIQWKIALQFILASLPGVWIGAEIFVRLPERAFLVLLGVTLLLSIPLRRWLKKRNFTPGLKTIIVIGFIFGIVSGTSVGSGLFVIAGLSSAGIVGSALLGTDAFIGIVNALSRAGAYYAHGALTTEMIIAGCIMSVGTAPGTFIASQIVQRLGTKKHGFLIECVIAVGGVMFLYRAITGS